MKENLINIGFNNIEADIYLELIKIGPQGASVIAKRLSLNRSSIYSILKSLTEKGVVSYCKKNNAKVYSANDPNCLVAYLDRRCKTYDYYKNEILTIIPDIRALSVDLIPSEKPVVHYLEGKESINNLFYDVISSTSFLRGYLGFDSSSNLEVRNFWFNFFDSNLFDSVNLKLILPKNNKIKNFFKQFFLNSSNSLELSFMDIEEFSEKLIFLYSGKILLISLNSGNEYGVVIESEDVYNFYKVFFDQALGSFKKTNEKDKN